MRRPEDTPSQCREADDDGKDSTLKAVIDSLDTPIFSLDTAYRYTSFNKAHAEMMKTLYGKDVVTGASVLECMTVEADRAVAKAQLDRTLRGERTIEETHSGEEPQSRRYFEVIQSPIKSAGGRVVGASIVVRDISERKRMEASLSESEAKYRSLFDSAGDSIFIHDEQGRILAANRVACEQLGYTLAELMGMTALQVVSPDEARHVPDRIVRLKTQGHLFFESVHCRKDGSLVPTEVNVRLVKWGGKAAVMSICRDISERKRTEEERRISSERYRATIDAMHDLLHVVDSDLRIVLLNKALRSRLESYGIKEDVIGRNLFDALPFLSADVRKEYHMAVAGQTIIGEETTEPNGLRHHLETAKIPLCENGEVKSILTIVHDVTERKKAEEALRKLNSELEKALACANAMAAKAEAASKAKSEFLAMMSHELRTPLNAIIGFTSLTLESTLADKQRSHLEIVNKRANDLLALIKDMLDLIMIESDKLEFADEEFFVEWVIGEAVETLESAAAAKSLPLRIVIAPGIPGVLRGDSLRLRQILINLIGNAVKFTEAGAVTVKAALAQPAACGSGAPCTATVIFSVEDTGIGIPDDKLEMIFEAFSRVDNTSTRKFEGTGLGLAICRRLVDRMNGRIWVESVVGRGSTFSFAIPFKGADRIGKDGLSAAESGRNPTPVPSLRILVAEDDQMSAILIQEMLAPAGHQVVVCNTGGDTLAKVVRESFDIVMMDIRLPDMNGTEAVTFIRRLEAEGKLPRSPLAIKRDRLPIVAITAFAMQGDKELFMAAGMDAYLSKPVHKEALFETLARLTSPESQS